MEDIATIGIWLSKVGISIIVLLSFYCIVIKIQLNRIEDKIEEYLEKSEVKK